MRYERPEVFDLGSIAQHTFFRCGGATGTDDGETPPKDLEDFPLDKFGECSDPGVS